MSKRTFALIGLFVALTTAAAVAQEQPTYEGRGYGGPLGVGPNFQQGGQWGPPIYGAGRNTPPPPSAIASHSTSTAFNASANTDDDDVKAAKKTPAPEELKEAEAESENSSIVTIGSAQDKTTPVTEQKKTDLAKSDNSKSSNESSTIASVASSANANADPVKGQLSKRVDTDASGKTVATCKRYFPTVGQTITVPRD